MKYNIDAIRCYQSVMFEKTNETFFGSRQINNRKPLELEIIEGINMVSIRSDRDHILIPLTNVSCVYLKSPIKKEQEERDIEKRSQSLTSNVIKKPKVKRSAYSS